MISKKFFYTVSAAFSWAVFILLSRLMLRTGQNVYSVLLWVYLCQLPFWIGFLYTKKKEVMRLPKRHIVFLAVMGFVSLFLVNVAEFFALRYSPAVNFSFLIRMVVPFTIILAFIVLGEPLTRKKIVLAILLLVGSYLFTTQGKGLALTRGDLFTLAEAAFIAIGNGVLGKMSTNIMSPALGAIGTFIFGFIPIALFSLAMGGAVLPTTVLLIPAIAVSHILITIFRFQAYKYGNASYVTMVFSFTPVFVSLMAIPFLGETLSAVQLTGGVLIVGAAVLVEKLKI